MRIDGDRRRRAALVLAVALLAAGSAGASGRAGIVSADADTMRLALIADATNLSSGDTVDVDLVVPVAGPAFNAYDAYVAYDPAVLTFLQYPNVQDQQGPLMWDACNLTFHLFSVAPDSSHVTIHHSLLCAGVTLTGPGVLYRLRFRAKTVAADTELRLERTPPEETQVIDDGLKVVPLATTDAQLIVNGGTAVPPPLPAGPRLLAAPNPFNPRTTFSFELDAAAPVRLTVHRLDGGRVRVLIDGVRPAGPVREAWDGRDDAGRPLPAGCYVARLAVDGRASALRISLVR